MMKKQIAILTLALGMMLSFGVHAQQKMGHINADQLLQQMPETKAAQTELEQYGKQLEADLQEMEKELQTKVEAYRKNQQLMTPLARETKGGEIQDLQMRIQEYSQKAQEDLQQKQVELLSPIIDKATKAVQDVAKENGFTYVLDSSPSKAVVIFAAENSEDLMPKVKAKLGIQ